MPTELYGNGGETTLSAAVDNVTTTLPVTSAAGFPSTAGGQYRIRIGNELMIVTGGLGTTSWTVIRGAEGTTAASHASGATVRHILTAGSLGGVTSAVNVRAFRSGALSVANAAWTALPLDAETFDTHAFHDLATNPSRFTVPAGMGGRYTISGAVAFSGHATGVRYVGLRKNGTEMAVASVGGHGGGNVSAHINDIMELVAGDFVELFAFQNSGGTLALSVSTSNTFLTMRL